MFRKLFRRRLVIPIYLNPFWELLASEPSGIDERGKRYVQTYRHVATREVRVRYF